MLYPVVRLIHCFADFLAYRSPRIPAEFSVGCVVQIVESWVLVTEVQHVVQGAAVFAAPERIPDAVLPCPFQSVSTHTQQPLDPAVAAADGRAAGLCWM